MISHGFVRTGSYLYIWGGVFQVKVQPHCPPRVKGGHQSKVFSYARQVALRLHLVCTVVPKDGEADHLLSGAPEEGIGAAGSIGLAVIAAREVLGDLDVSCAGTVLHGDTFDLARGMLTLIN